MANRERGDSKITVDGREYILRLSINAQCELEDRLSTPDKDVKFADVVRDVQAGSRRAMRAFLWACLLEHHGAEMPTPKDAGILIEAAGGANELMKALLGVADDAAPDPRDLAVLGVTDQSARPPDAVDAAATTAGTGARSIDTHAAMA